MSGRESLKGAPTEWKMCHVGTLQRRREGRVEQEWRVGRDEPMEAFGLQRGRAGLAMGLERAERVVFLSDGLPANRRIGLDPFPGQSRAARRRGMPGEGEGLQVIAELKGAAKEVRDRPEGWKRIRCFQPNSAAARWREPLQVRGWQALQGQRPALEAGG